MKDYNHLLFIRTLDDIKSKLNGDGYDYLKATGLMRSLIIDGGASLVDIVNRDFGIKIKFVVRKNKKKDNPPQIMWRSVTPQNHEIGNSIELNRTDFLKEVVLVYNQYTYTVYDVIMYAANMMGGIHAGIAKDEKADFYKNLFRTMPIMGGSVYANSIFSVMEVVIKSLEPLYNAVLQRNNAEGF